MKKYDSYTDSGVEWLGELPEHWEVKRIKDFSNVKGRIGFKGYTKNDFVNENEGALVVGATEMNQNGFIDVRNPQFISWFKYYESPEIMLKSGQILIVQRGSTVGKVVLLDENIGVATINPSLALIKDIKANAKFILYYLMSSSVQGFVKAQTSLTAIPMISQDQIGKYEISLPTNHEQTIIAQYLDVKTQAIDKKVNLLERKIGYYKELRKSIINETVTKGLDRSVKLKDSGIDWIGQIPEHWEVRRFKDSFEMFTGNSISDKTGYENPIDAIPYVATKDIDFDTGHIDFKNGIYILKTDKSFKKTKSETSLICIEGANAGKKIGFTQTPVSFVNKLCAIKGKSYISDDKYNFYYLNSFAFSEQFFALINGLIGGVSINKVKEFLVLLPPKSVQTQIVTYLDHKTQTIDKIVGNIQSQIATLKELRKTLINDVVTGKIKVVE